MLSVHEPDSDINLDGKTIYAGPGSDTNYIASNVFLNPRNRRNAANFIVEGGMTDVISR